MTFGRYPATDRGAHEGLRAVLVRASIVAIVVLAGALFGNFARPIGHLSAFWPANALLLGLMVRNPRLASATTVFAAALAYVAGDLIAGGGLRETLLLTMGNIAGVGAGYAVLSRFEVEDQRLSRPMSIPYLVFAIAVAAATAGVIGGLINPILFNRGVLEGWTFWFTSELVNYAALLPVILTFPDTGWWRRLRSRGAASLTLTNIAPVATLLLSCAAAPILGGPGAVVLPLPGLLWCAFTFNLFVTAVLTLLFSVWTLLVISTGYLHITIDDNAAPTVMSIRLGVTLIALAPITVGAVNAARDALLRSLRHMATYDQLTDTLNRAAFREHAAARLGAIAMNPAPVAALMIDIDHFKAINDTFGHAAGDQMLVSFAAVIRQNMREKDILGRLGGEEFALLLPNCSMQEALHRSNAIRTHFAGSAIELDDGTRISCTASFGLAFAEEPAELDLLLLAADRALYRAKRSGRNKISTSRVTDGIPPPPAGLMGRRPGEGRKSAA